jgi:hypothetical protein
VVTTDQGQHGTDNKMLTKTAIDRAEFRAQPYIIWDDELAGFGCKVFPSGRRSFIIRYRLRGSLKRYQPTIGTYGAMTVAQARVEARVLLNTAKLGRDPQAETKARRAAEVASTSALTVTKLVGHYVEALHAGTAVTKRLRGRHASPGYLGDTVRHLDRFAAMYGHQAADTVNQIDVLRALHNYILQPSTHRRMHGAISRMYAWGRKQAWLPPSQPMISTPHRHRPVSAY